jgi:hypothetical protein
MATVITAPSAVRTVDMKMRGFTAGLGLGLGFGLGEGVALARCAPTVVAVARAALLAGAALLAVGAGPAGLALQATRDSAARDSAARDSAARDTAARDTAAKSAPARRGRFTGRTRSTIEARCDGHMNR